MANKYPIKWRGETFYASDLTDGVKAKFCQWVYDEEIASARIRKSLKDFIEFDRQLTVDPPEWTTIPRKDVLAALNRPDKSGLKALMRIILDIDKDRMSDELFAEMIKEKESEGEAGEFNLLSVRVANTIKSDLDRAMTRIREDSDPKAQRGEPGSPRPEDASGHTQPSATNQ